MLDPRLIGAADDHEGQARLAVAPAAGAEHVQRRPAREIQVCHDGVERAAR